MNSLLYKDNESLRQRTCELRAQFPLNKKVLLIQAPLFLYGTYNPDIVRSGGAYAYPPVGLQFIKSSLASRGLTVDILDLNFEILKRTIDDKDFKLENWIDILDSGIAESGASVFGVSCTCVPGHPSDPDFFLTSIMQRVIDLKAGIVIAGGSISSKHHESYLNKGVAHIVVSGEGEYKTRWLFDLLYDQEGPNPPQAGVYFLNGDEVTETTGAVETELSSTVLDTYPDLPLEEYWRLGCLNPFSKMTGRGTPYATVQLNRGCRANCKFCGVFEFMGKGVRQRDPTKVINEISYLVKERNVRHIDILDDDFLGTSHQRSGLVQVLKAMGNLHEEYGITWAASNGLVAASIDEELLELMSLSGCNGFRMGIESGNEEMVRHLRRPSSLKVVRKVAQMLQKHSDIFVCGCYIIGFFGTEKFSEIMDTYRLTCELQLDWAAFSVFQFTSKLDPENQTDDRSSTNDFVPARDHWKRLIEGKEGIVTGPAVFQINLASVPSPEQIKEIWFAFNLLSNYVSNKNLYEGGRADKLISWIDAVHISYPDNAYMPLFSALGHILINEREEAMKKLDISRKVLATSEYWSWRFKDFGLMDIVDDFPQKPNKVYEKLESLRNYYRKISPDSIPFDRRLEDDVSLTG